MNEYSSVWDSVKSASAQHQKSLNCFVEFFSAARDYFKGSMCEIPGVAFSDSIQGNWFGVKFAERSFQFEYRFSTSHKNRFRASVICYECLSADNKSRIEVYSVPFKSNGETNLISDSDPVEINKMPGAAHVVLLCIQEALARPL